MNKILIDRIKNLIDERNITQKELAYKIGVTEATLSRNLNGIHEPKAEIVNKLAEYFDVSSDYLLGLSDDRVTKNTTNINDIDAAFFNQHGLVNEDQKKEVESFIQYLKSKETK